jgi:hypothetical protein
MFDDDVLPLHHYPLDEEPDEPLPAREVKRFEALGQGGGEGSDIFGESFQLCPVRVLHGQFLSPGASGGE